MSYSVVDDEVTDFEFSLTDWGTSGHNEKFFGGTPGHCSNWMYKNAYKDTFSLIRLALDLFVSKTGTVIWLRSN